MLRRYIFSDGKLVENGAADAPVLLYINPTEEERRHLIDDLKIDEHTLTSALDPDELSRLEIEPEHVAIIFKRPRNYSSADNFLFKVWSFGVFLFPDRVVLVQAEDVPLFDGRHFVRMRTPLDVVLRLVNRTIVHFLDHLKGINMIAGELEQKINTSMENRYLLNMFTIEKSLVYYLNAIYANGVVIEKLKNSSSKAGISGEQQELLDDLVIDNNQCYRQATILSNILSGLMDARASIVNNNLNVLMKTLNMIMLGLMLPMFVVSAFSMNVAMPFNARHPAAFWAILVLAGLSLSLLLLFWRRKRW